MFNPNNLRSSVMISALFVLVSGITCQAQTRERAVTQREYPKEIRGYKLERVNIETKDSNKKDDAVSSEPVITFGDAHVVSVSPLGVTIEIPMVVRVVKAKGRVDFLTFYDMTINGRPVEVDDYNDSFDMPNDHPLTLRRPLTVFVGTTSVLSGAVEDFRQPKETWPVTGVVYVFGQFKKWIFKGKRVVPVELDLRMRNPLRKSGGTPALPGKSLALSPVDFRMHRVPLRRLFIRQGNT